MKKIMVLALAGLAACATPEGFYYEVSDSSPEEVRVQTHENAMNMDQAQVAGVLAKMQSMADAECAKYGKGAARFIRDRRYTGGPYNRWVERVYECR